MATLEARHRRKDSTQPTPRASPPTPPCQPPTLTNATRLAAIETFVSQHLGGSRHERRVAHLAAQLFRLTSSWHGLSRKNLLTLKISALLHDIGRAADDARHPQLGARLIQRTHSLPLTPRQRRIAAFIARYHRGAIPSSPDTDYLRKKDYPAALILLSLLRAADALDSRSHGEAAVRFTRHGRAHRDDRKLTLHITPRHVSAKSHKAITRRKKYRLLESTLNCTVQLRHH